MEDKNISLYIPSLPNIDEEVLSKLSPYSRSFIKLIQDLKKNNKTYESKGEAGWEHIQKDWKPLCQKKVIICLRI